MDSETTSELTDADRHQLNHRELYLSRQLDTLPATHIRLVTCNFVNIARLLKCGAVIASLLNIPGYVKAAHLPTKACFITSNTNVMFRHLDTLLGGRGIHHQILSYHVTSYYHIGLQIWMHGNVACDLDISSASLQRLNDPCFLLFL